MESAVDRMPWRPMSGTTLLAIAAYQRWLSPRKGFACAYRVRHGGTGCSGFTKHAIRARGLAALPLIDARLRACRLAAMAASPEAEAGTARRKEKWYERLDCGVPDCSFLGLLFGRRGKAGTPDIHGDGGGCDVGPCDLSW